MLPQWYEPSPSPEVAPKAQGDVKDYPAALQLPGTRWLTVWAMAGETLMFKRVIAKDG